ncbi:MAG: CDC48 family AAA ATPase [Candidatus Geothermarchaeales archaeon]
MSSIENFEGDSKKREVLLKVKEANPKDVGRGKVRISSDAFRKLGATPGDIVLIEKKRRAVAIVWHSLPGSEKDIIMMDGELRRNAGASLNDQVSVRKVRARPARKVFLAPLDAKINVDMDFERFVHARLIDRALVTGNVASVNLFGSPLSFVVKKTVPSEVVHITPHTQISVSSEPVGGLFETVGIRYEDIGGLKEEMMKIREMVELPLRHPVLFRRLGIEPPKGVLLQGPSGCGKTLLARAVTNESEANFYAINGPEITSKYYGESEAKLREIFKKAEENAPSIIFIDELDAIAPRREEVTGEAEKRVVAQLLTLMDGLKARGNVVVIGASNRVEAIDPALRRPGRFDREIEIKVPDKQGRKEILQIHTRGMPRDEDVNLDKLAEMCHGYTGADLEALCKEAAMKALRKYLPMINLEEEIPESFLDEMKVCMDDFLKAYTEIVPTAMREVELLYPDVRWNDIGGLEEVKRELREAVEWPLKYPEKFKKLGITPRRGILLYGPPGTGKTLLAQAVASRSNANFIAIKGPELLSKWVGESEKGVRKVFARARTAAPVIIFFDEVEALVPRRGVVDSSGVTDRVISQVLTEMDGINRLQDVVVIAATNRPDLVDEALIRPGRIDLLLYVPPPNEKERLQILRIHTQNTRLSEDVDLEEIARMTENYSGADLDALVREAALNALRRDISVEKVERRDFEKALEKVKPSLNERTVDWYKNFYRKVRERFVTPIAIA